MQKRIVLFSILLALAFFVVAPATTHAAVNPLEKLQSVAKNASYETTTSLEPLVGTIINIFLSILGTFFLALIVYGGFIWMNAQGAEEDVTKAKKIITQAIIGLAVIMAAYAISYFVTKALETGTTATS